jgi:hypothetical protein
VASLDSPTPAGIYTPMLLRRVAFPDFCEPCLPSPADKPPAGAGWLHEIKHDGFLMLVRREALLDLVPLLAFLHDHKHKPEDYPEPHLDDFKNLLRKCVRGSPTCERLVLARHECRDIRLLHAFRNDFAHFPPHHSSQIELAGLPRMIGVALNATDTLMNRHEVETRKEEDWVQYFNEVLANAKGRVRGIPVGQGRTA